MATTESTASYESSVQYLESLFREPHLPSSRVGLRRASVLLQGLGNPHRSFRSVHVAGSTGKGSTTSMVASILGAAGHRTGAFRSPHLLSYRERIAIGDEDIPEESWLWAFRLVYPLIEAMRSNELPGYTLRRPTLFEVLFAMACLHFSRQGVEWAAVETGLGGRLDATNLLQSDVAAITNVSLEHTQILGATLAEIAAEKAAIIKQGAASVTGATDHDVLRVIEKRARNVGAPLLVLGRDFGVDIARPGLSSQEIVLTCGPHRLAARLGLGGRHQAGNAGVAYGAAMALRERGVQVGDDAIRAGLERTRVPGRLESFLGEPEIILDGAHNPAGMEALAEALSGLPAAPTTLLFAAMDDKNIELMASTIAPYVNQVVVTQVPGTLRSAGMERLERAFATAGKQACWINRSRDAYCSALHATPPAGRLVVAGSMYLVGEIRPLLLEART